MINTPIPSAHQSATTVPHDGLRDRLTDPDYRLSDEDFATVSALIYRETGILITPAKKTMLVSRLSRRMRHLSLGTLSEYVALLSSREGDAERRALVSVVTTNVTSFFREPHHFKALETLTPALLAKARSGRRVRLWSAGCSTGQEPYSIAASLLTHAPDLAQYDVRILATDIDPAVIETAHAGVYDRSLLGERPHPDLARFVEDKKSGSLVSLSSELRALIRFEVLNLIGQWPFHGQFDVIFCRNVVIYFDVETRQALWSRFANRLLEGGTLFIGHSERMDTGLDPYFKLSGITQYCRTEKGLTGPQASKPEHSSAKVKICL